MPFVIEFEKEQRTEFFWLFKLRAIYIKLDWAKGFFLSYFNSIESKLCMRRFRLEHLAANSEKSSIEMKLTSYFQFISIY